MKDIFAPLYELFMYDGNYSVIFDVLYKDGGYVFFGSVFIIIPLAFFLLFYLVWKYPYGKFWHWMLWYILSALTVFGLTWNFTNIAIFGSTDQSLIKALADSASGYEQYAQSLPMKYAALNTCLALIFGFVYSIILKQFSKIQMHLPF